MSAIAQHEIPTIYGSYDYAIGRDQQDCMCAYPNRHDRDLGQPSVQWTLEHADRRSKDFMRALPFDLRLEPSGRRVLLVHGSPRKVNEYLFEDKPARTFERIAGGAEYDAIDLGDTHRPWIHEYGDLLFVNCFGYDAELASRRVAEAGLPASTPRSCCSPNGLSPG